MLDDQHRVPRVHQPLQNLNELVNVGGVEARGGLVENIDGIASGNPGQLRGKLHPLGLAAGEGGAGLAQLHIPQAHFHQGLDLPADFRQVFKEVQGFLRGHVQNLGDVLFLVLDLQSLPVVPGAVADLAGNVHVRQKVHFDLHQAVAAAGLAPAALDVEGEAARAIAPDFRVVGGGKEVPDVVKKSRISGGI